MKVVARRFGCCCVLQTSAGVAVAGDVQAGWEPVVPIGCDLGCSQTYCGLTTLSRTKTQNSDQLGEMLGVKIKMYTPLL